MSTRSQDRCDDENRDDRTSIAKIVIAPAVPRGGETVRLTGTGLTPGEYMAQVGPPGSDAVIVTSEPVASVAAGGVLDVMLVLPDLKEGTCQRLSIYQRNARGGPNPTLAQAPAFVVPGNISLAPGRCEDLSKDIWARGERVRASITPPPYRVGAPITVTGTGLAPSTGSMELGATLEVVHDPSPGASPTRSVEHGAQSLDARGNFAYTFTPRESATLSGRCVEISVFLVPWKPGSAEAVARFTYP